MENRRNAARRRLSATSNTNTTGSDEVLELLHEEHEIEDAGGGIQGNSFRKDDHGDLSKWLRPAGLTFAALMLLAIFAKASLSIFLSPGGVEPFRSWEHAGHDEGPQEEMLAIQLHPESHLFRLPQTITHRWTITSGFRSPDGVKKRIYMVNGQFPGPTIECRSGDRVVVHVTNELSSGDGVSIHWHGLEMRNANHMDGAVGLTQCPIPVNRTFTYEFDVGQQAGTFWWHAHSQVQRGDGMYGGLVVHQPARVADEMQRYGYEYEVLLLVGDWYHRSADEVLAWYTSARNFGNEVGKFSLV